MACRNRLKDRLAAYEDTGLDPRETEEIAERLNENIGAANMWSKRYYELAADKLGATFDHLRSLVEAEQNGRLVVLPFQMGKTLLDCSDPERPELLSNFRVALAYDHYGIVFHQPLNIFLENVQKGYIRELSEAAEQALEGGKDHA